MDELVAFLKDRLQELEAESEVIHDRECDSCPSCCYLPGPCVCGVPVRVLADVASKRQILNGPHSGGGPDHHDEWAHTVRLLALPYQSHSLYQESWKPA